MDVHNFRAQAASRQFQDIWASPKLSIKQKMDVFCIVMLPISLYGYKTWTGTEVEKGRLGFTHCNCLRCIVGMKLTDRHKLVTTCEQCGMSSLDLVYRRTLQWMGHVLQMDGGSLAAAEFLLLGSKVSSDDGRMEQLKY
eukprot:365410-Chlamydomonas_euryale.AAC.4